MIPVLFWHGVVVLEMLLLRPFNLLHMRCLRPPMCSWYLTYTLCASFCCALILHSLTCTNRFCFSVERLEVTYSYWDGSGHRREIVLNKGVTVGASLCGIYRYLVGCLGVAACLWRRLCPVGHVIICSCFLCLSCLPLVSGVESYGIHRVRHVYEVAR